MALFREFEDVSEKYISMFELYCERNILSLRIPDTQVGVMSEWVLNLHVGFVCRGLL